MIKPSTTNVQNVAVLGTGTMGSPIARNIAKGGFSVRAWNRTRDKAASLAKAGSPSQTALPMPCARRARS
jgi:3-hydroxyisobutyrate dehydrogenase-like beta-hydroxyacid dehydrogenase